MNAKLAAAAGALGAAALFCYAAEGVDFSRLIEICRQADYFFLALLLLINPAEAFLRAIKWKAVLGGAKSIRYWTVFKLELSGMALNNVLPFRLGEFLRAIAGAGAFKLPIITIASSIALERALDIIALIILLFLAGTFGHAQSELLAHPLLSLGLLLAAVIGISIIVFADKLINLRALYPLFKRFSFIKAALSQIAAGAAALKDKRFCILALLAAIAQWFINALCPFALVYAFHLQQRIGLPECVIITAASAIACTIPAVPGFFGNYEAGIAAALSLWGIKHTTAFAFAFAGHIIGYLVITALGLICTYSLGYSLSKIWRSRRQILEDLAIPRSAAAR